MTRRVLVTGASGFAGRHMCRYLAAMDDRPEVIGVDVVQTPLTGCDRFLQVDLSSSSDVAGLVRQVAPDCVIHLAGLFGADTPQAIYQANVLSATSLLEAVTRHKPDAVVVMAGSAAEYGRVAADQLPVTEWVACRPVTTYGLSKLLATEAGLYYHRVNGLQVMMVRPFQLVGKGVTTRLAPGAFAEQLRHAMVSGTMVIKVGNLESSRDFIDITDAAEAIWALCCNPAPGEVFNICSGIPTRISQLLEMMVKCSGVDVRVEVDPEKLRGTADVSMIMGSYAKLQRQCGWQPRISLETSIRQMLE